MLGQLKRTFDSLRRGEPGHRFVDHHERRKKAEGSSGPWKSAGYIILGVVLLAAGFLLSLPPGVPGFLLWIPGLGLLAVRFRILAVYLDKSELLGRRLWGQLQRLGKRLFKV